MSQSAQAKAEYLRIENLNVRIIDDLNTRKAHLGERRTRVVLLDGGKVVAHLPSEDSRSREILERMWSILKDIRHPSFTRFYRALYDDEGFYGFVREYCPYHDPYWRNLFPRLTLGTFLRLGAYLAFGAHRFHQSGHILGDITPWNICFKRWSFGLRPCYMDFDTATRIGNECGLRDQHDRHIILGTPSFISPEQLRGDLASPQIDQFGLAVSLLSIATGTTGFTVPGASVPETFARAQQGTALFPYWEIVEELLPTPLCMTFDKALQPQAKRRFPDCLGLGHALKAALRVLTKEELDRVLPSHPWSEDVLKRRAILINHD